MPYPSFNLVYPIDLPKAVTPAQKREGLHVLATISTATDIDLGVK